MNETATGTGPRATARTAVPPPPVAVHTPPVPQQGPPRLGKVLARAAAITAALTVAGSVLGLVRDQSIAHLFGAGSDSDAFLISWTVPEMASTLLIEDAMALVLVPAFSHALARRAAGEHPDPVRSLVSATLPRLLVLLGCTTGLLVLGAPVIVELLAPGLAEPQVAVQCTRLTALTVLSFGVTGYLSAALRAHRSYLPPATIYVAYNVGIIVTMLVLHSLWGVRAAAAGVAAGSVLMVLAQLPAFVRHLAVRPSGGETVLTGQTLLNGEAPLIGAVPAARPALLGLGVLAPVLIFTVCRQSQVLVERFLAASLPAGSISHLNYAQKVAQVPMMLSLMICTVTFPVVAKAVADGEGDQARRRVERDLALAGVVVLAGTAVVVAYAPQIIEVLFQRGAFSAADTATTASIMRVYALGLLGQCLVGALGRPFFSTVRPTWFPAAAMAAGLLVNGVAGALAVGPWGVYGITASNALGITVTAVLLLRGLGSRVVSIHVRGVALTLARLSAAAVAACAVGLFAAPLIPGAVASLAAGCLLVPGVFAAAALALRAPEIVGLLDLTKRRFRHVR
ncbi:virulence factor MviN [Streptomyces sp. NBC_00963]|uniref:murein biosynthesis integral membrane protein MurJ n=1 Tax=unclassified Streptomyces TaxID=2593676 RepID=UPI00224F8066|nr:lipid II flippase MurJ [Streptomyces sp. NBC_01306]MCX4725000.1 virulence factor MviN [Streptomyces sp. NBC_01306]WSX43623.1 virulence factor MviN [Streptomyces sp. NBC_00963]